MFSMIRFAIYFTISFGILCIPFGKDQRIFDALYAWSSPYAKSAVNATKQKLVTTTHYSKKLFSNSSPSTNDEVSITRSALLRDEDNGTDVGIELEEKPVAIEENQTYTDEEKKEILKALRN